MALLGLCVLLHSAFLRGQMTLQAPILNDFPTGAFISNGISLFDLNGDGSDELTLPLNGEGIGIWQWHESEFAMAAFIAAPYEIKQIIWVDYDNDGDRDLFFTAPDAGIFLFKRVDSIDDNTADEGLDAMQFEDVSSAFGNTSDMGAYAAAWGDYDRDGLLDVYITEYKPYAQTFVYDKLFHNLGNDFFEETTPTVGAVNQSNNCLQPTFTDYNGDQWPDIIISNDHERGTNFFTNMGGNSFQDLADTLGANAHIGAMCNSWADYDHDGDFDFFMSNSDMGHVLLRNDGDSFVNQAAAAAVNGSNTVGWGGVWIDLDSDGWEDLYVPISSEYSSFGENLFYHNNHDGTFTPAPFDNANYSSYSAAKGDFNNDGYWDLSVRSEFPTQSNNWMNTASGAHWIKVATTGTISNRDGIGVRIEAFVGDNRLIFEKQCGEGYITQHSGYEIIGLKDRLSVDSLHLFWPSGMVDRYYSIAADQFIQCTEGETSSFDIIADAFIQICAGDSVMLSANNGLQVWWNENTFDSHIWATDAGTYSLQWQSGQGLWFSDSVVVAVVDAPQPQFTVVNPLCYDAQDGHAEIQNESEWSSIAWHTIDATHTAFQGTSNQGCVVRDTVVFILPDPIEIIVLTDSVCNGMNTWPQTILSGGVGEYTINWLQGEASINTENGLPAGNYSIDVADANGCAAQMPFSVGTFFTPMIEILVGDAVDFCNGSMIVLCGVELSGISWSNGSTSFIPDELCAGFYSCEITDANSCVYDMAAEVNFSNHVQETVTGTLAPYPNPCNDHVLLPHAGRVRVHSADGKLLCDMFVGSAQNILLNDLPTGIYILSLDEEKYTIVKE
jgi:hypothetical protein